MTDRSSRSWRMVLFVFALGCGPQVAQPPPVSPVAPSESAPTCPPALADLGTALGSLAGVPVRDSAALPFAANAPAITIGPVLEISTDTMTLEGRSVSESELGQRLGEIQERAPQLGHPAPTQVLVAAAANMPVSMLTAVLTRIPSAWRVQLLTRDSDLGAQDCAGLQAAAEQAAGACDDARTAL